jgi:hypothetical protein
MNRFHSTSMLYLCASFAMFCATAHAQELYKWTDANGKVHYGDRAAAPETHKKMHVIATARSQPQAVAAPVTAPLRRSPPPAHPNFAETSAPVSPGRVGPACKSLIDKIAAVPAGQNWEALFQQFDRACPGIAYECVEYQSSPQNNRCTWVERSGSRVLNRKKYP